MVKGSRNLNEVFHSSSIFIAFIVDCPLWRYCHVQCGNDFASDASLVISSGKMCRRSSGDMQNNAIWWEMTLKHEMQLSYRKLIVVAMGGPIATIIGIALSFLLPPLLKELFIEIQFFILCLNLLPI